MEKDALGIIFSHKMDLSHGDSEQERLTDFALSGLMRLHRRVFLIKMLVEASWWFTFGFSQERNMLMV